MKLKKQAMAGTMESSDLMVVVQPSDELSIMKQSPVIGQFGDSIRKSVEETAQALDVRGADITVDDHGALDCTIRARVETALLRAMKED